MSGYYLLNSYESLLVRRMRNGWWNVVIYQTLDELFLLKAFQGALFQEGTVKYAFVLYQCFILQFLEYISLEMAPNNENWREEAFTGIASWIVSVCFVIIQKKILGFSLEYSH